MKISSIRMNLLENSKFLAIASIVVDNAVALPGIRLGKREDGSYYLLMPASRRKDNTFRETFHPVDNETRDALTGAIGAHYERVLNDPSLSGEIVAFDGDYELNITDVRVTAIQDENSYAKAVASVTLDGGFVLKGMRILPRGDCMSVSMPTYVRQPREEGEKTRRIDTYHPITAEARKLIVDAVLAEYERSAA